MKTKVLLIWIEIPVSRVGSLQTQLTQQRHLSHQARATITPSDMPKNNQQFPDPEVSTI